MNSTDEKRRLGWQFMDRTALGWSWLTWHVSHCLAGKRNKDSPLIGRNYKHLCYPLGDLFRWQAHALFDLADHHDRAADLIGQFHLG